MFKNETMNDRLLISLNSIRQTAFEELCKKELEYKNFNCDYDSLLKEVNSYNNILIEYERVKEEKNMNENKLKVYIGNKKKTKNNLYYSMQSYFIKPCGKFWKRYFNKKVRKGKEHKRCNWWEWS